MGMSRRNRRNGNYLIVVINCVAQRKWDAASDTETELIKLSNNIPKKSLGQRLKNKERKKKLKKGKIDFVNNCLKIKNIEPIAEQVYYLPPSQPSFTPSSEVAAQVLAFLAR